MSFPPSVLEDPPLGEGWDENGNDLSKIANDVSLVVSVHDVLPKKIVREDGKKWQKVWGGDWQGKGGLFGRWHRLYRHWKAVFGGGCGASGGGEGGRARLVLSFSSFVCVV